jgi:hypothetical protein
MSDKQSILSAMAAMTLVPKEPNATLDAAATLVNTQIQETIHWATLWTDGNDPDLLRVLEYAANYQGKLQDMKPHEEW